MRTFEDAPPIRLRLAQPSEGCILVVNAGGSMDVAVLSDRLGGLGLANSRTGMLIDGAVRDADALRRLNFAVFALGTSPARATRSFAAAQESTLAIRDILFMPGDFVVMDTDGVVVVTTDTARRAASSGV